MRKKNLNIKEVNALSRDQAKQYCDKWKVVYRGKDGTEGIKNKIKKFLNLTAVITTKKKIAVKKTPVVKRKAKTKFIRKADTKKVIAKKKKVVRKIITKAPAISKSKSKVKVKVKSKVKTTKQAQITFRQIGANIILVVDKQQHSKRISIKSDRETIKELVLKYNSKNTIIGKKRILKYFGSTIAPVKKVLSTKRTINKPKLKNKAKAKIVSKRAAAPKIVPTTKPTRRTYNREY